MIRLLRWLLSKLGQGRRTLAFPVPRTLARPQRRRAIGAAARSMAVRLLERRQSGSSQ